MLHSQTCLDQFPQNKVSLSTLLHSPLNDCCSPEPKAASYFSELGRRGVDCERPGCPAVQYCAARGVEKLADLVPLRPVLNLGHGHEKGACCNKCLGGS